MSTSPSTIPKCAYRPCSVTGPNVPKLKCNAVLCERVIHSYCYNHCVLHKHLLPHFIQSNPEHPFLHVACKKQCYGKIMQHVASMALDPEDWNIPWNRDGKNGPDNPENLENILITWLQHPGNYSKFRSPPCGKTKGAVCKDICKKLQAAGTLKLCRAAAVLLKVQLMEKLFCETHEWVNNTGVGVLESDGPVTFREAVKKGLPTTTT